MNESATRKGDPTIRMASVSEMMAAAGPGLGPASIVTTMNDLVSAGGLLTIGLALFVVVTAGYFYTRAGATVSKPAAPAPTPAPALPAKRRPEPATVAATESAAPAPRDTGPRGGRDTEWLRLVGVGGGLALASFAIELQGQLWSAPGDLRPFWWLLAVGAALASSSG